MKLNIDVQKDGVIYSFGFLNGGTFKRIIFENEFIIDLFKVHNHSYSFKAFFYNSKFIYSRTHYNSKRKLFCAVQEVLKEELYHVLQY